MSIRSHLYMKIENKDEMKYIRKKQRKQINKMRKKKSSINK